MASRKDIQWITIDSQLVINSIVGKMRVPKDLVEDVGCLLALFMEGRIEYCNMFVNREGNVLPKSVHLYILVYLFLSMNIFSSFLLAKG